MDWISCPFTVKNRFLDLILVASLFFSTGFVSRTCEFLFFCLKFLDFAYEIMDLIVGLWSLSVSWCWVYSCNADGYDPLDPNGNVTIRWDVIQDSGDGNQNVSIPVQAEKKEMYFIGVIGFYLLHLEYHVWF